MKITPRFTAADADPFAEIEWVKVTSEIRNPDGSVVFHQQDVEVPKWWSQTAADVLAQKYFRRAGVPDSVEQMHEDGVPFWLSRSIPEYGATFGRETSARQVFHRLAGTWTYWGWKGGYFSEEADASAFYNELIYMLAHQMCAPNSPQWFNTGLHWAYGITSESDGHYYVDYRTGETITSNESYEHPQPHACFIQSVDDRLLGDGSIFDLWDREARLFKYGSGTGTNFSNIRGDGERLSSGGKSSGLMSFLKIGDRAASAIKSGGAVRRAAKMVILDADHPDIFEFVNWKVKEEQKVAALVAGSKACNEHMNAVLRASEADRPAAIRAARKAHIPESYIQRVIEFARQGVTEIDFPVLTTDWDSEAYVTVSGQNSNNTVRVPDGFMKALEADGEWELSGRVDPSKNRSVKAREIWDAICSAAWACADPGLQFSTTINDWHTCPEDGEIRASNPCCFVGETLVDTSEGRIRIDELRRRFDIGESLPAAWAYNAERGEFAYYQINRAWSAGFATTTVTVCMSNGDTFDCTPEHKWLLESGEYCEASKLTAGTRIMGATQPITVDTVISNYRDDGIEVFDIEVDKAHNFSVTKTNEYYAVSNSEYLFLDNTACNLASLNLIKFRNEDGTFRVDDFRHAVRLWTVVLEISVLMAQFPSREIAEMSYRYRTLGLGFANIGGLLMSLGLAYDSDEGRALCAAITSLMTGQAYLTSAEMAQELGAFEGYERNSDAMLRVIRKHMEEAHSSIFDLAADCDTCLHDSAYEVWHEALRTGRAHGFRNAQVSVIAPTGTIGLVMDCDTTGIEPDFAMVKFKKLAGGGWLKLINQMVPAGLRALGYSEDQIADIITYAVGTDSAPGAGTVEGAPHIQPHHLSVFDCANKAGQGIRFIPWEAHLKMMAAAQPFVSGAISKTINMPHEATLEDVSQAYLMAWKLGLKAVALYRDGSKLSQPLNASASQDEVVQEIAEQAARVVIAHGRRKLPDRRGGYTQKAVVGGQKVYMRTGEYEDGTLGEIFVDLAQGGAEYRAIVSQFAIAISIALQYGVPLDVLVEQFTWQGGALSGMVRGHDRIKMANSLVDYIFRELAITYLDRDDMAHVKEWDGPRKPEVAVADTVIRNVVQGQIIEPVKMAIKDRRTEAIEQGFSGECCSNCQGMRLKRSGTCSTCIDCGTTTGCS